MSSELSPQDRKRLSNEVDIIVKRFKREYPWIKSPISDSYKVIEELGFFILGKHIDEDISGFNINIGNYKCIFINRSHHFARQNQSLWHEVYHWYANDTGHVSTMEASKYTEMEFKAENFASKILIDRELLLVKAKELRENLKFLSRKDIVHLQNYFNVSYMNILMALKELIGKDLNGKLFYIGKYENHEKLISFCDQENLDRTIYDIPQNDYITASFIKNLEENYKENRITDEYLEYVFDLLDEELNMFE